MIAAAICPQTWLPSPRRRSCMGFEFFGNAALEARIIEIIGLRPYFTMDALWNLIYKKLVRRMSEGSSSIDEMLANKALPLRIDVSLCILNICKFLLTNPFALSKEATCLLRGFTCESHLGELLLSNKKAPSLWSSSANMSLLLGLIFCLQ